MRLFIIPKLSDSLGLIARRRRSNHILQEIATHLLSARNDGHGNILVSLSLFLGRQ